MKKLLLVGAFLALFSSGAFASKGYYNKAARCTTTTTTTIKDLDWNWVVDDCRTTGTNCTKTIVTTNPIAVFRSGGILGNVGNSGNVVAIKVVVVASILEVAGQGVLVGTLDGQTSMTLGTVTFQTVNAGAITVNVINAPYDPATRILTIPVK